MATITASDVFNSEASRFAMFLCAYKECSEPVRTLVDEMAAIIVDRSIPEDEREHAAEAIAEALFPARAAELIEFDEMMHSHPSAIAANRELDQEEDAFVSRLSAIMSDRDISQEKLAELTGVGQPAISNMLRRRCRPQRRTVVRFAEALKVKPEDLWPEFMAAEPG